MAPAKQEPNSEVDRSFVCGPADSVLSTIEKCLNNGIGACLVTNPDDTIAGRICLEDLRKAVLSGHAADHPVEHFMTTHSPIASVPDLNPAPRNGQLDVVLDKDGRLTKVSVDRSRQSIQVGRPTLSHSEFRAVLDAFLSSWISSKGPYVEQFEKEFSGFVGTRHGVAVTNGTVALHLALVALGIGPGDEVIVPDLTFVATINAVLYCGAKPVIVDVDPTTWGMSVETISIACTSRTRAIIPVHLYGRPVAMAPIMAFARARNIAVIEDCAEAPGASCDDRNVGQFGDIACFSFYANKIVTSGEGGMCLTNSDRLAGALRVLRDHGMVPDRPYWHDEIGYNYRLTNLQAAIGHSQLQSIGQTLQRNARIDALYRQALRDEATVRFPEQMPTTCKPVIWMACIQVPAAARDNVIMTGRQAGIEMRPFFYPLSALPPYKSFARTCPHSIELSRTGINLPTSGDVNGQVINRVADVIHGALR